MQKQSKPLVQQCSASDPQGVHAFCCAQKLPHPIVGTGTGFHPDATGGKISEPGEDFNPLQRTFEVAMLLLISSC